MKYKLLLYLIFLLNSFGLFAQDIEYLGGKTVSGYGNNTNDITSTNFNIPAGKNRVVVVTFNIERQHSGNNGSNHITNNYTSSGDINKIFGLKIGGKNAIRFTNFDRFSGTNGAITATLSNASITNYYQSYFLREVDDLPTGYTTFDWSTIKLAANIADEIIVNIAVFGNVSQNYPSLLSWNYSPASNSASYTTSSTLESSNFLSTNSIPIGRNFGNRVFFGNGYVSHSTTNFTSNWTEIDSEVVINDNGINNFLANTITESGGITSRFDFIRNVNSYPTYTIDRNSTIRVGALFTVVMMLEPLANPSLRGTVFLDKDGASSINGIGTNRGAQYVNIIDVETNRVVYVSDILDNGNYTVPIGVLIENYDYKAEISTTRGTIGNLPPAKTLATNWGFVGESKNTSGNDGNADGTIEFKMGNSNIINYNFGIVDNTDTDNDGIPDYLDLDDDNDGILDTDEGQNCFAAPNLSLIPDAVTSYNWVSNSTLNPHSMLVQTTGASFRKFPTNGIVSLYPFNNELITYTFNTPVSNLHLSILDLDHSEVVNINLYDENGNRIPNIITSGVTIDNSHSTGTLPTLSQNSTYGLIISATISGTNYNSNLNYVDVITNHIKISRVEIRHTGTSYTPEYQILGYCLELDSDNDGIPNHLDLDSDGDGCPDALEGDENVNASELNQNGSINTNSNGGVNNNGVPNLVNTGGSADIGGDQGQGAGEAYDPNINTACDNSVNCYDERVNGANYIWFNTSTTHNEWAFFNHHGWVQYPSTWSTGQVTGPEPGSPLNVFRKTIQQPGSDGGYVLDIYALDNSFNMEINGVKLALEEIQFQFNTSDQTPGNIRFLDGSYTGNGAPNIWNLYGDVASKKPILRIIINENGFVKIYGSKASYNSPNYQLQEMTLFNGNSFNNLNWNKTSTNQIIIRQLVANSTMMVGNGYGRRKIPCPCTKAGNLDIADSFTKIGISSKNFQTSPWPENIPNGWLALDSKEKGLVITRVAHVDGSANSNDAISEPKAGMIVYDIQDKCVKLYNGQFWACISRSCNENLTN